MGHEKYDTRLIFEVRSGESKKLRMESADHDV